MGVKGKIVALVVATLTALTPVPRIVCGLGVCHTQDHSPSMPCHAKHTHDADGAVEAATDHSCCHVLPAVPTPLSARATVSTALPQTYLPVPETFKGRETLAQSLESLPTDSPLRCPQQSHSCVLLI